MTSNEGRATILERALRAAVARDHDALRAVVTDDVRAWTPSSSATSLAELVDGLEQRDEAFSDPELAVSALDVGGDHACAEWTLELTHTGPISLDDGRRIEPTGLRVAVHGATVAEFDDDRICALRQYWDELSLLEQLGVDGEAAPSRPA